MEALLGLQHCSVKICKTGMLWMGNLFFQPSPLPHGQRVGFGLYCQGPGSPNQRTGIFC